jgi:putative RecB family exonuclease
VADHRTPTSFASREQEATWGTSALEMLSTFARSFDLTATPLAREQWLSARLENGLEVFGKLDRIDTSPAGGLELIIDYKTGRRQLDPEDLPSESAARVYVMLAEHAYAKPVESVRLIYVALGRETRWEPEREDVVAAKDALRELCNEITTTTEFQALPGAHCRFCPAALHCADRQRVAVDDLVPVEDLPF